GKRLSQLSFAFDVLEDGTTELDDGTKAHELRKLKVYEASFVPVGANQDTSIVAVKSAADMLTAEVKAGRVISAKNESSLRESVSQITAAAESLNNVLSQLDGEKTNLDVDEASGNAEAKTEEPEQAKAEEPKANPSVEAMSQLIHIYEQLAQEGDSQ
ncbi:MAG: HK97 family phage prohead protease, partial [Bifidobacterium crudilactis]|nr:HK97 family phage prohead protease [Bifidobacterium crudilactis]